MKTKTAEEYSFDNKSTQAEYDKLRTEGKPPHVSAVQALRNEYKRNKSTISSLEDRNDAIKERTEEITGGDDMELPEGRFRFVENCGTSVKKERLQEEHPDLYERYVSEYSYSYYQFD